MAVAEEAAKMVGAVAAMVVDLEMRKHTLNSSFPSLLLVLCNSLPSMLYTWHVLC
jgi:hypothetical protein